MQSSNYKFSVKVIELIRGIPRGKVAAYGQIAAMAGKPRGSRAVAWILHSSSKLHRLPWHRVINARGSISFPPGTANFRRQRNLLRAEGIEVSPKGGIDLGEYTWRPKVRARGPRMFGTEPPW